MDTFVTVSVLLNVLLITAIVFLVRALIRNEDEATSETAELHRKNVALRQKLADLQLRPDMKAEEIDAKISDDTNDELAARLTRGYKKRSGRVE